MTDDNEVAAEEQEIKETVEKYFDKILTAAVMTPLGDPDLDNCKWGLPVIFWGLSGIGKSDIVEMVSEALNLHCEVLYPGTMQPEDFSGIPFIVDGRMQRVCDLPEIGNLVQANGGMLFIDEASCAPPAVQGGMLSLVLKRKVASTFLPGRARIVLAANPPEYAAGGWGLEAPFANRMAHFHIGPPSADEWTNWLMTESSPSVLRVDEAENHIRQNWLKSWVRVKGLFAGFIKANPMLHEQPKPENPQAGYNWPSPRTWWMAGRAVAAIRALNMDSALEQIMVEGCVGEGPAGEWAQYAADADLPDPEEALIQGWQPDTMRIDRTVAVYASYIALTTGMKDKNVRFKYAELCWKRLQDLCGVKQSDLAINPAQALIRSKLGRKGTPDAVKKAAEPVIYRFAQEGLAEFIADN